MTASHAAPSACPASYAHDDDSACRQPVVLSLSVMRRVEQRPVVAFVLPLPPVPMPVPIPVFPAIEAEVEGLTAGSRRSGHWVGGGWN